MSKWFSGWGGRRRRRQAVSKWVHGCSAGLDGRAVCLAAWPDVFPLAGERGASRRHRGLSGWRLAGACWGLLGVAWLLYLELSLLPPPEPPLLSSAVRFGALLLTPIPPHLPPPPPAPPSSSAHHHTCLQSPPFCAPARRPSCRTCLMRRGRLAASSSTPSTRWDRSCATCCSR